MSLTADAEGKQRVRWKGSKLGVPVPLAHLVSIYSVFVLVVHMQRCVYTGFSRLGLGRRLYRSGCSNVTASLREHLLRPLRRERR